MTDISTLNGFDFSDTPRDLLLPAGVFYNWQVKDLSVEESKSNKTMCSVCKAPKGKRMIVVTSTVLEPAEYARAELKERFVVGVDADPCAHNPQTLAGRVFGAVFFGQLLDATETPRNQTALLIGKRFQRAVTIETIDTDKGKLDVNNFAKGVYPIGTVPVGSPVPETRSSSRGAPPSQHNNSSSSAVNGKEETCPRCNKAFPSAMINDHVADCAGSGI